MSYLGFTIVEDADNPDRVTIFNPYKVKLATIYGGRTNGERFVDSELAYHRSRTRSAFPKSRGRVSVKDAKF